MQNEYRVSEKVIDANKVLYMYQVYRLHNRSEADNLANRQVMVSTANRELAHDLANELNTQESPC